MTKGHIFSFALLSIILIHGFGGTALANSNAQQDSRVNVADHSVEVNIQNEEPAYPIAEGVSQQSSSLGVNTAGNDSIPFIYNILIGAVVLAGILFFFRTKSTSK